jgi:hypothetical protein
MISYTLKCSDGHRFESWFQSAAAFDSLKAAGHLSCAICGSGAVDKAIMAPAVTAARNKAAPLPAQTAATVPAAPDMPEDVRRALEKLKRHVEANSDYVGTAFARQARDMHLGDIPERPIYGEVTPKDAKALLEDGVPVMPLPFTPTKKAN